MWKFESVKVKVWNLETETFKNRIQIHHSRKKFSIGKSKILRATCIKSELDGFWNWWEKPCSVQLNWKCIDRHIKLDLNWSLENLFWLILINSNLYDADLNWLDYGTMRTCDVEDTTLRTRLWGQTTLRTDDFEDMRLWGQIL